MPYSPLTLRNTASLSLFFLVFTFSNLYSGNPFVHRDGRLIKDSLNRTITLRGVNLGGWLLWEGWMWGDGLKSQTRVMRRFTQLVGKEEAGKFREAVFRELISESDIREIAAAGFNVVRLPFNHRLFDFTGDSISDKSLGWVVLDSVIGWCRKYGVYAVIDMHAAPGGQSIFFIADHTKHRLLWHSEDSRAKTIALWKAIARHYASNPVVAGYDLLNEPVPPRDIKLVKLYERIITSVRLVDPNHLVFLEGAKFAKRFTAFHTLPDSNTAFSFHIYTWFGGDAEKKVKMYSRLGQDLNAPVWCGEWGENNYEIILHTRTVMEDPSNAFSGWCYWSWKRVHSRFPNLNEIEPGTKWKTVMGWFKYPDDAHKPTKELTLAAMKEFLAASHSQFLKKDTELYHILTVH